MHRSLGVCRGHPWTNVRDKLPWACIFVRPTTTEPCRWRQRPPLSFLVLPPLVHLFDSQGSSSITNAHTTIQPHATSSLRCSQRMEHATAALSLRIRSNTFLTTQIMHMVISKRPHCKEQVQRILASQSEKEGWSQCCKALGKTHPKLPHKTSLHLVDKTL